MPSTRQPRSRPIAGATEPAGPKPFRYRLPSQVRQKRLAERIEVAEGQRYDLELNLIALDAQIPTTPEGGDIRASLVAQRELCAGQLAQIDAAIAALRGVEVPE